MEENKAINKLLKTIDVPCYQTDALQYLKPASFMDMAQEEANLHACILGFGYDDLQTTRTAWVLSRMHIKFYEFPKWRDTVSLETWHKGQDGLFYLRDFNMTSASDGRRLVAATTSWLVLNIDTRRLVRNVDINRDTDCRENALDEPCPKVQLPAGAIAVHVGDHKVAYSDIDLNGHTNNAMYIVWAMDAMGYNHSDYGMVTDIFINFNHETRPGDIVSLSKYEEHTDVGCVSYIEGTVSGKSAFVAEIRTAKPE